MSSESWRPQTALGVEIDTFVRDFMKKFPAEFEQHEHYEISTILKALLGVMSKQVVKKNNEDENTNEPGASH